MTHLDPWGYAAKARAWSDRADPVLTQAQADQDVGRALDALAGEGESARAFQEARRLF